MCIPPDVLPMFPIVFFPCLSPSIVWFSGQRMSIHSAWERSPEQWVAQSHNHNGLYLQWKARNERTCKPYSDDYYCLRPLMASITVYERRDTSSIIKIVKQWSHNVSEWHASMGILTPGYSPFTSTNVVYFPSLSQTSLPYQLPILLQPLQCLLAALRPGHQSSRECQRTGSPSRKTRSHQRKNALIENQCSSRCLR